MSSKQMQAPVDPVESTVVNGSRANANPSELNYIIIDSQAAMVIPALMFALGVLGNGIAIMSLLTYKCAAARPQCHVSRSSIRTSPSHHHEKETMELSTQRNNEILSSRKKTNFTNFGPFHTLVLALLSVDLSGNIATSPVTLFLYSTNTTILAAGGDLLCGYSAFTMMFLGIVTMASLTAMAIERALSIRCPYFYHRHISTKTANIAIFIIVLSCAIFSALPVAGFGKIKPMFPYTWCFADWQADEPHDITFNFIYAISGIIMICTTLICNITVVVGLFRMKLRLKLGEQRSRSFRRETQMIIQLVVMTGIYLLCWLPLLIRIIDNQVTRTRTIESGEKDRIAIWLAAANPILDPWVYILLRRAVVKRLLRFPKSVCFSGVQDKLRIGIHEASTRHSAKPISSTVVNQ